ncbi:MAG TPA: AAA family ATPase [Ktedonobacteraceae bacterium]|nr:AAA family ATPase [Ktedonobacteraceae bacterium]
MDNIAIIKLPRRTLLVLAGPAGSGKSTFARKRFIPTMIVSSDYCRALVSDDENNQHVNRDAFDLFYYIIHKRMFQGRFTVADSTALQPEARRRLLDLAHRHGYLTCLLIFNVPEQISRVRNLQRERKVEEQVHGYHAGLLQQTIQLAPTEGWNRLYILSPEQIDAVTIEIEP